MEDFEPSESKGFVLSKRAASPPLAENAIPTPCVSFVSKFNPSLSDKLCVTSPKGNPKQDNAAVPQGTSRPTVGFKVKRVPREERESVVHEEACDGIEQLNEFASSLKQKSAEYMWE